MTISKALRDFEKLETAILKDGKVDWDETLVLLDFIRPYVNSRNKRFIDFEMLLTKCRKDGKIDADESKLIIDTMLSVKRFLKMENHRNYICFYRRNAYGFSIGNVHFPLIYLHTN